jgi:glycosyltransferase involved in cell wall biosynthesis
VKISATIITLDEERHVERCLRSLRGVADEMVVVDSGSHDRTLKMAEESGARVFTRAWTSYSDQKNFATGIASHDWILSIDADECLSDSLRDNLLQVKAGRLPADAFAFPRMAFYLGRWIRHSGWYPDYKTRLYAKDKARWEGEFVHERLVVKGQTSRLKGDLLHYTCDSLTEHAQRLDHYTTLAAQAMWTEEQRASLLGIVTSPLAAFAKSYLFKTGFLDGYQGLLIAGFAAYYNFLKLAKLWELQKNNAHPQ